jgi:hypothetical protein
MSAICAGLLNLIAWSRGCYEKIVSGRLSFFRLGFLNKLAL